MSFGLYTQEWEDPSASRVPCGRDNLRQDPTTDLEVREREGHGPEEQPT